MSNSLITASMVRDRLGLPDDEGVNAAIKSAMVATRPFLMEALQTGLDAGSAEDVFFIDPLVHMAVGGLYVLRANNGFLKKATVKVGMSDTLLGLQTTALDLAIFYVSEEKGFIKVPDLLLGKYVKVAYDYGFRDDDEVPEWLQEAALSYTIKVLSAQQVGDNKPSLSEVYKFIDSHGSYLLGGRLRVASESIRALN